MIGCGPDRPSMSSTERSHPGSATAVVITDEASARAAVGRRVRIKGTAENGKHAAVVAGAHPIYCLDRDSWPSELEGREVEVEGVLEVTDEFAEEVGPDGVVTQGTRGNDLVLRGSTLVAP